MHEKLRLSNSQIKYLGAFFMFLDHFALILLPGSSLSYLILRGLGRLAAPIFFWSVSQGALYTRRPLRYLGILAGFGLVFQLVFLLAEGGSLSPMDLLTSYKNIFLTLSIGVGAILLWKKGREKNVLLFPILIGFPLLGEWLNVDYGWYGVLMIMVFYVFREKKSSLILMIGLLNLLQLLEGSLKGELFWGLLQCLSMAVLPLILLHSGERGRGSKWFFYLFYPLHLLGLQLLQHLL